MAFNPAECPAAERQEPELQVIEWSAEVVAVDNFSSAARLAAVASNSGLPTQEGIGHGVNDTPGVSGVGLAGVVNSSDVPSRIYER